VIVVAVVVAVMVAAEVGIAEMAVVVVCNRTRAHQRKGENGNKTKSFRQAH
jgi:hypothetical protein